MGFTVHCHTGGVFEKVYMLKVDACQPTGRHARRLNLQVEANDAGSSARKRQASGRLALRRNG